MEEILVPENFLIRNIIRENFRVRGVIPENLLFGGTRMCS